MIECRHRHRHRHRRSCTTGAPRTTTTVVGSTTWHFMLLVLLALTATNTLWWLTVVVVVEGLTVDIISLPRLCERRITTTRWCLEVPHNSNVDGWKSHQTLDTNAPPPVVPKVDHKICMILPNEEENDKDDINISANNQDVSCWNTAAIDIAQRIGIPYLHQRELIDMFTVTRTNANTNDEDIDDCDGDILSDVPSVKYTHILRLIPYDYSSFGANSDSNNQSTTYALAIESLDTINQQQQQSHQSTKRNRHRSKQKKKKRFKLSSKPFFVDLFPHENSKLRHRTTTKSNNKQQPQLDLLVQAVKPPRQQPQRQPQQQQPQDDSALSPFIIHDWTAGLGQDSTILALASNVQTKIWMFERDPIVGVLLQDAIRRLQLMAGSLLNSENEHDGKQPIHDEERLAISLSKRLHLILGEGKDMISSTKDKSVSRPQDHTAHMNNHVNDNNNNNDDDDFLSKSYHLDNPDVIYLDPMFPARQKSAAVKKGMSILQELLETNTNNNKDSTPRQNEQQQTSQLQNEIELLHAALQCAKIRVVVKRPIHAPSLGYDSDTSNDNKDRIDGCDDDGNKSTDNSKFQQLLLPKPSYSLKGSINRFDVYVVSSNQK